MVSKNNVKANVSTKTALVQKISIEELETTGDSKTSIYTKLAGDKGNAYTISGLLVQVFGLDEKVLLEPFKEQPPKYVNLYSQVSRSLKALVKEGKVAVKKSGKSFFYWAV